MGKTIYESPSVKMEAFSFSTVLCVSGNPSFSTTVETGVNEVIVSDWY